MMAAVRARPVDDRVQVEKFNKYCSKKAKKASELPPYLEFGHGDTNYWRALSRLSMNLKFERETSPANCASSSSLFIAQHTGK